MDALKIVEINKLTIHFNTLDGISKVLEEANLDFYQGEVVGLVGETGCGKSIIGKSLLGILQSPPANVLNGEIIFRGKDLLKIKGSERAKLQGEMGYIPQDPMTSLNPVFTIGQIMIDRIIWKNSGSKLPLYLINRRRRNVKKTAMDEAVEILQKVHIPDPTAMLEKYPIQLSGGLRQRVLIAMALIGKPRFLVADEPTTALDVTVQKVIIRLLQERIKEENLSGIYITHDLGVTRIMCQRTYVMYAGNVVEMSRTEELMDNPLHPYTKGLIQAIPKLTADRFKGISGNVPNYFRPPKGCRFFQRCNERAGKCEFERPTLREVDKERYVACWALTG
jgi:oligopeptide/dipeptide ABC transporter ATP-binding protein